MSNESQGTSVIVVGRIVWTVGNLFQGRVKTDEQTRQPVIDPKTNQPVQEYGFGLAIPKTAFADGSQGAKALWDAMIKEGQLIFPQGFPPDFAWKYKDCDQNDQNGQPFRLRKGYENSLVFAMTTRMPIKFYRWDGNTNVQISEGIKCGDYVEVQVSVKAHPAKGRGKPGLYLNPMLVRFNSWGEEIINTPTGDQIFGSVAPIAAPGGSMAPLANPMPLPQPTGAPVYQQPVAPQAPAMPHHAVLPQAFQPQQAVPAAPAGFPQPGQGAPSFPSSPGMSSGPATQPFQGQFAMPAGQSLQPQQFPNPMGNGFPAQPAVQQPMNGYPQPAAPAMNAFPSNPQMPGMPFPGQR